MFHKTVYVIQVQSKGQWHYHAAYAHQGFAEGIYQDRRDDLPQYAWRLVTRTYDNAWEQRAIYAPEPVDAL